MNMQSIHPGWSLDRTDGNNSNHQISGPVCHSNGIRGFGNNSAKVVIIGIAPGSDEIRTGIPFIGQSGKILDSILGQIGYPRNLVYTTNLVCVYNNNPPLEQITACFPRLHRELQTLKPRLIVTLGKLPSEYFGGRQFGKLQSAVLWNKTYQCWHLSTFHPAASLHGDPNLINNTIRDLAKILQILEWPVDYGTISHEVI